MKRKLIIGIVVSVIVLSVPAGFTLGGVAFPSGIADNAQAAHSGDNIYVDDDGSNGDGTKGDPFETIQEGINHASPGDKIIVASGTYEETVVVNKSVTVFTNKSATLDGSGLSSAEYAFNVTNPSSSSTLSDVVITGFEITGYSNGIQIHDPTPSVSPVMENVTVYNNTVQDAGSAGIYANYQGGDYEELNIVNNTIESTPKGIFVNAAQGTTSNNTRILANTVNTSITETGILVRTRNTAVLTNVTVVGHDASTSPVGMTVDVGDTSNLSHLNVTANKFNSNTDAGLLVEATGEGYVKNVDLQTIAANTTQSGSGLEFHTDDLATITDLAVTEVVTDGNQVGLKLLAEGDSTISDLNISKTLHTQNDRSGVTLQAGAKGTSDSATIKHATVSTNAFNETSSGPGLNVSSYGMATITNLTVFQNAIFANQDGLRIGAKDDSTVHDVNVTRALIQDSSQNGVLLDGGANGVHDKVRVRYSLIENSGSAGVYATQDSDLSGVAVNFALISDNTRGVDNQNSATFDARWNWWGDSTGPSSESDTDAPFEDPNTGKLANGNGDTVSEDPTTAGVSNVNFDPAIGGNTQCQANSELLDPIPDQSFSFTVAGRTISGQAGDFVGLCAWERSPLPLRADHQDAATKVLNAQIYVRVDNQDIQVAGSGSNRPYLKVFQQDQQFNLDFEKVTGADTTQFANEDVKLLVLRANESMDLSGANATMDSILNVTNTNITTNENTGEVTISSDAAALESRSLGSLDGNGQIQDVPYTPEQGGEYVFLLASVDRGDGFTVTQSGNFTFNVLNDSSTVLGVEVVSVQTTDSSVTPNETQPDAGDTVAFDAQSNLQDQPVTHAVVLYDKTAFEDKVIILNSSGSSAELTSGNIVGNATGTSDGQPFFLDFNVSTNGTIHNITTKGSLDNVSSSLGLVESGSSTDTVELTVPTGIPFDGQTEKTFQWVHVAVSDDNLTSRSTDEGTIQVQKPPVTFPVIDLSPSQYDFGDVQKGSAPTKDFTVTNDGNATLEIQSTDITGQDSDQFSIISGGGPDTLAPGDSKTITVEFAPDSTGVKTADLEVDSNDTKVTADLEGTGVEPAPIIDLSPTQYDFGEVRKGSSESKDFTVTNDGNAPLKITSTSITGQDDNQFSIVSGSGQDTLGPDESKTITVEFAPESTGDKTSQLRVDSNDTVATADLEGTGKKKKQPPSGPPGGQPGAGPPDEPGEGPPEDRPAVNVTQLTPNNLTITINNTSPGAVVNMTLPPNFGAQGVFFQSIHVHLTNTTEVTSFTMDVSHRGAAPAGTPGLDITGEVPRYLVITPQGITDDDIESVVFRYKADEDFLAEGEPPRNIKLNRFNDASWGDLPTEHVKRAQGNLSYRSTSPGLSAFAVSVGQSDFEIVDTDISPTTVEPGETATVTATIRNNGDGEGVFEGELTTDSQILGTESVSIPEGETRTVEFEVSFDEIGSYTLALNDQEIGTLTVETVTTTTTTTTTTATTTTTTTPSVLPEPLDRIPWGLVIGILALIGIIALVVYVYRDEIMEFFGNR